MKDVKGQKQKTTNRRRIRKREDECKQIDERQKGVKVGCHTEAAAVSAKLNLMTKKTKKRSI